MNKAFYPSALAGVFLSIFLTACNSMPTSEPLTEVNDRVIETGISHTLKREPETRAGSTKKLCDLKEEFSFNDGSTRYQLSNLIVAYGTKASDCPLNNFAELTSKRYLFVFTEDDQYKYMTQIQLNKPKTGFSFLPDWYDARTNLADLQRQDLIDTINGYDTHFDSLTPIKEAAFWFKTRTSKDNGERTHLFWSSKGFKKTVYSNDGKEETCSTSGEKWRRC